MAQYPIHTLEGTELPPCLRHVHRPPEKLRVQGSERARALLSHLPERGLAVVGTRSPQPRSLQQVRRVLDELRGTELVIVSGLARGIDAEAHRAALAQGLPTVAILGCGLAETYPREHLELRGRILAADGLVISELDDAEQPLKGYFLNRNRLIAALSHAVWVAAAPARSGALNTAKWARDLNRTVFASPCFPGDPALAGNERLLDEGGAGPVWGSHSFGSAWLGLAARIPPPPTQRPESDLERLKLVVREQSAECGGASVPTLLEWAWAQGWSAERFFAALQHGLSRHHLIEEKGAILTR